jgi:hypothetical protein
LKTKRTVKKRSEPHRANVDPASVRTDKSVDKKSVKLKSLTKAVSALAPAAVERTRDDAEARSYFRFLTNLQRANRLYLVTTLGQMDSLEGFFRIGDDVCRSSVVFLHAALEDYLRSVGNHRLPFASKEVINEIPLVSLEGVHPNKFLLGELLPYRNIVVGEVVAESVKKHLLRRSFTSYDEVRSFIAKIQLDSAPFEQYRDAIDQMMKRRHKIVHESDLVRDGSPTPNQWSDADHQSLLTWTNAVTAFGRDLFQQSYITKPVAALTRKAIANRTATMIILSIAGLSESAGYLTELEKRGMTIEQMQEAIKDQSDSSSPS